MTTSIRRCVGLGGAGSESRTWAGDTADFFFVS